MAFIEMTGAVLDRIISEDELHHDNLKEAGVVNETVVRINRQGDIEVRRHDGWDVVGGLIGDFEDRVKQETGLEWA